MSDENNNELITSLDSTPLDIKNQQIAQKVLTEDDIDKVKDLTKLFNLNIRKKNVLRTLKMNDLLDKVTDQVVQTFEKTPNNFSNEDLITYMQVIENSIDVLLKILLFRKGSYFLKFSLKRDEYKTVKLGSGEGPMFSSVCKKR